MGWMSLFSIFVRNLPPLSGDPLVFGGIREKSEWNRGTTASVPISLGTGAFFIYAICKEKQAVENEVHCSFLDFSKIFFLRGSLFLIALKPRGLALSLPPEKGRKESAKGGIMFPPFEPPTKSLRRVF